MTDAMRDMPITAEWLREIGFKDGAGYSLYVNIGCSVSVLPHRLRCSDCHNVADTPWEFWSFPDDCQPVGVMIAEEIPTRGRVLDLLSGLGVLR